MTAAERDECPKRDDGLRYHCWHRDDDRCRYVCCFCGMPKPTGHGPHVPRPRVLY